MTIPKYVVVQVFRIPSLCGLPPKWVRHESWPATWEVADAMAKRLERKYRRNPDVTVQVELYEQRQARQVG